MPEETKKNPHLLRLAGLPADEIRRLLTLAHQIDTNPDALQHARSVAAGKTVALVILENSTRTRGAFATAANRVGAHAIDLSQGTSAAKGESLIDTARTLRAQGTDLIVIRTKESGGAANIATDLDRTGHIPVINAGDGKHEHPTQGLLDTLTLARATNRTDSFDLTGLRVGILGDVISSRVARSDIAAMTALGAEIIAVGPPAFCPKSLETLGCRVEHNLDEALPTLDALQILRVQFERHAGAPFSARAYREDAALTIARARRMKLGAFIMHPGPMNRGTEIDHAVAEGPTAANPNLPKPLIEEQVRLGVPVRIAIMTDLLQRSASAATQRHETSP